MMLRLLPVLFLAACIGDETLTGYGAEGQYALRSLTGAPPIAATISFPRQGDIFGQAPCNAFSATQSAPYPWFRIGEISATRATCADQAGEAIFFEALGEMREAETLGDVLILRGGEREMVFDRIGPPR